MKKLLAGLLFVLIGASSLYADQWVNGYWRDSDGDGYKDTWVRPHWRSDPDGNIWNNWSTKGNINPYTGKPGYIDPLKYYSPFGGYKRRGW